MEAEAKSQDSLSKRDYWERHFSEWKASGLSQAGYQALHGLNKHVFAYWKKKLKSENDHAVFVPVTIEPDSSPNQVQDRTASASGLSLHFGGGIRLEIEDHFRPDTLRRVMSVLGRA